MIFADYIENMPEGVIKTLFTVLHKFTAVCTRIANYASSSLHEIIVDLLDTYDFPDKVVDFIDGVLSGPWAWVYNISLFDLILGGALILIVVFGIVKYFTDIIF